MNNEKSAFGLIITYIVLVITLLACVYGMQGCASQKRSYSRAYKLVHKADGISKPGTIGGFRSIYPVTELKADTLVKIDTLYKDSIQYQDHAVFVNGDSVIVKIPCNCKDKVIREKVYVTQQVEDSSKVYSAIHVSDSTSRANISLKDDLISANKDINHLKAANRKKGLIIASIIVLIGGYIFFKYKTAFLGFFRGLFIK